MLQLICHYNMEDQEKTGTRLYIRQDLKAMGMSCEEAKQLSTEQK